MNLCVVVFYLSLNMDVRLDGKCDGEAENDSLTSLFSEAEKQLEQLDGLSTQDLQVR